MRKEELAASGFGPGALRHLRLVTEGYDVPFDVGVGGITFYARGLDTPYTDARVYWLTPGMRPGRQIPVVHGTGAAALPYFPYTFERKERTLYFAALRNGEAENFFGAIIAEEPVAQTLTVISWAGGPAALEVTLLGVTTATHQVQVAINGTVVGTMSWAGQTGYTEQFVVPDGVLRDGDNALTLTRGGDEMDVSLVDALRLTYWRRYEAEGDTLRCTARAGSRVTIPGFTSPKVQVWDVTDPMSPKELVGTTYREGTGYTVTAGIPGEGERTLFAFAHGQAGTPAAMVMNEPSRWASPANRGDLVIITHQGFEAALTPLKALREQQGLLVAIVDVEDLYDEFAYGQKSPYAIREFLTAAKSWRHPPRYVLLVGDATFDPRNYLGLGAYDLVPTKLLDTDYLETASDGWFGDSNHDGVPDIAIGRLPVRTVEEAKAVIAKLLAYETAPAMDRVLLVADEVGDDDFNFEAATETLVPLVPTTLPMETVLRGRTQDARGRLLSALNAGPLLVNYVGHGSVDIWRGDLLTSSDAPALTNGTRLPFVVGMTCLNGLFHNTYSGSLAEALLLAPHGGAIAVWASSGLTEPEGQAVMNRALFSALFSGAPPTIGEAITRAKTAATDPDVKRTWNLLGDPSVRLRR